MEYGITANGFSMRRLDEIYNASCKRFEDEIGVNPSENPQSVMNVYLLLSVKVTSNDELDADFETRIKSLLMAEKLLVGSPIRLQKFIRPIIENVSGVDYIEIRGILSEKQDIEDVEDGAMLTGAVPVSISQQPVVTMDGIRVVKA